MVAETKLAIILERKIPRMAAPLMLDKDLSVSHSAIGAILNISLVSPDICEELVRQVEISLVSNAMKAMLYKNIGYLLVSINYCFL